MLPLPGARVQFLVRELRSHKPQGVAKKKKKKPKRNKKDPNRKREKKKREVSGRENAHSYTEARKRPRNKLTS